jgi:RHS repeat-associated protein/uncharacterized repeat protein (TIGR01451 family)
MQNRSRLVSLSPSLVVLACLFVMSALPVTAHGQTANRQASSPAIPLRFGPDSDFAGNLFLAARDIEVPCSLELRPYLDRSYNSRSARTGYFGKGWTADPFDIRVEKRPDGKLIVVMGDGREDLYELRDGKDYRSARPGESDGIALAPTAEGGYLLRLGNGQRWEFNAKGYLVTKRDLAGNLLTVRRDRNGIAPLSIEGSFGKKLTVQWKSGRIAAIEGPSGLRVEYRYDARGRLAAMLGRTAQNQTYTYDTMGLLARVRTPGGLDATFSHQGGLLSGMRREDGTALSYRYRAVEGGAAGDYRQEVYNESGQFLRATEIRGSGSEWVLVDGLQNRATLKFDRDGRLVASQGPEGREERWRYSAEGILEAYDDSLGNRTTYHHSPDGLKLTVTDPRGAGNILSYDLSGFLENHVDPWGVVTKVRRDGLGRVTEVLRDGVTLTRYRYDRRGFVDRVEGLTGSLSIERDALGRVTRVTDAEGRSVSRQSDILGRPLVRQDGEGRTTRWSYDPYGRLSAITDGAGGRLQFTLSNEGLLRTFTDANGNTYRYDYKRGLPYALTFPNGTSEYTQLDALGRIVRETNHRGQAVEYTYDKLGRLVRQSYPGGFTEWQYDNSGRLTKASNAQSAYEIRYDRFGETAEIRDARGRTTRYEYNDKGQRTALIDPEGKKTLYEYDRRGSLSRITGPGGETYKYEYDPAGRLMKREYPNGISCLFGYDRSGALSSIHYRDKEGKTIHFISVLRDKSGRIVSHRENEAIRYYWYDALGRLIRAKRPDGSEETFGYDRMGNRVARTTPASQKQLTYGRMNELLSDGPVTYRYDADGQPADRSDGFAYEFDTLGRLTDVRAPGKTIRYEYDPFGRLVARDINGRKTEYLYDKEDIIAEYDGTTLETRYVHGPGIDEPLSFTRDGKLHVLLSGLNDTVRRVYGSDGLPDEDYELSPFGEIERPAGVPLSRQLFNARDWDPDARLYYVRARFYDPATGRFISPDPIRFRGGWNLYAYGNNDPLNNIDPLGFYEGPGAWSIGASVFAGKLIGFKAGTNYTYFGPNDPRNGFYISVGGGLDFGMSMGVSTSVSHTESKEPYKTMEGPSIAADVSTPTRRLVPGISGSVSLEREPWLTAPDITGIQPLDPDLMNLKSWATRKDYGLRPDEGLPLPSNKTPDVIPNRYEPPPAAGRAWGVNLMGTKQVYATSDPLKIWKEEISPDNAKVKVGDEQPFKFEVSIQSPTDPTVATVHDVTQYAKWSYRDADKLDLPYAHTENPFTCPVKGKFLIWAKYDNEYIYNPSKPGSDRKEPWSLVSQAWPLHTGAEGSATVECIDPGAAPPPSKDIISFTHKTYEVRENAGYANITVSRNGEKKKAADRKKESGKEGESQQKKEAAVIAQIRVKDGTATAGKEPGEGDYNKPGNDRVTWGEYDFDVKSVAIPINNDDLVEGTEDVNLELEVTVGNAVVDAQMGKAKLLIKDVLPSGIGLTKTPSASQANDGDQVTFTIEVTNTGKSKLKIVRLADSACPGKLTLKSGDRNGDGFLDTDEKWIYECPVTLNGTGLYENRATVEATDEAGGKVDNKAVAQVQVGTKANIVPNVVGMEENEAIQAIQDAGLTPRNEGNRASDLAVGLVCAQEPEAGQSVSAGTKVGYWITRDVPKYLYLDPPRKTLQIGQQVSFEVTLVSKNGKQSTPSRGDLSWDPGPDNSFKCEKAGKFIVWAKYIFAEVYGSSTVTCEEDWSAPLYQPPITSSGDRGRVPQAGPEEYKWYAYCDPRSGEVTYGEHQLTGRKIMAGPFPGPRTAYDWINGNCPRWRCDAGGACAAAPARGGEWKVLCGRQDGTITVGRTHDAVRYILVQEGFLGEPDARAWASRAYPSWQCAADGSPRSSGPTGKPGMGGSWAVVCSKRHGGVSLTRQPDSIESFILGQGFMGEPDARLWTDRNCPSWRCNSEGRCLAGVAKRSEGRPLETPPESEFANWWRRFGEGFSRGAQESTTAGRDTTTSRRVDPKPPVDTKPPPSPKPGGTASKYPVGTFSGEWDALRGTIRDSSGKQAARNCDGVLMGGPIRMTVQADGTVDGQLYNDLQSYIYRIRGRVDTSGQLTATAECYLYRDSICWKEVKSCTLRGTLKPGASGPSGSGTLSCGPNTGSASCTGPWGR